MEGASSQNKKNTATKSDKKRSLIARAALVTCVLLVAVLIFGLIIDAFIVMNDENRYVAFGEKRFFSIESDLMEPSIAKGSLIATTKPRGESEIKPSGTTSSRDGTVITFKVRVYGRAVLVTSRVVSTETIDGKTYYITRGDNASELDPFRTTFEDIAGIYSGSSAGFFGTLFYFFHSEAGVIILLILLFAIGVLCVAVPVKRRLDARRRTVVDALKKCEEALSGVSLRYDNINEITAVMDVLGNMTEKSRTPAERKAAGDRLKAFVNATSLALPQTAETAAILDSLPAPDTPGSLAAALSAGATLRQAEDGQSLILTTITGGKHIVLTPVHTPEGIILCQQGARVRTDIAPNIEDIGVTSMPTAPEFFEGQPLEKIISYPELPQPDVKLGPASLLDGETSRQTAQLIAANTPALGDSRRPAAELKSGAGDKTALPPPSEDASAIVQTPQVRTIGSAESDSRPYDWRKNDSSYQAYTKYREQSARQSLDQAEQLGELLDGATPLSAAEKEKLEKYRAEHAKPKKPRPPRTPEQKNKAKAAADRRRIARKAMLDALSPEDRELFLSEEKLARTRSDTIKKLKRLAADRKLLERIEGDGDGADGGESKQ